jgi:dienelactone hydrolase
MKCGLFFLIFITYSFVVFAQKPPIDIEAVKNWPSMQDYGQDLTADGKYFEYTINNSPVGSNTIVVRSTDSDWEFRLVDIFPLFFSDDSKKFLYKKSDSIYILTLGTNIQTSIGNVESYKSPKTTNNTVIACLLKNGPLVLRNLVTNNEIYFESVRDYSFNDEGTVLLLSQHGSENGNVFTVLRWVNLLTMKSTEIWSNKSEPERSETIAGSNFDTSGTQLVFCITGKNSNGSSNSIWYYNVNMMTAVNKIDNFSPGIDSGLTVSNYPPFFSKNGKWIFFKLQLPSDNRKIKPDAVKVDVWSYKDIVLQSEQINSTNPSLQPMTSFVSVVGINDRHVRRLESEKKELVTAVNQINGDVVVLRDRAITVPWWRFAETQYYLYYLINGSSTKLKDEDFSWPTTSPHGKYVVYYDRRKKCYFSYDIINKKINNISAGINTDLGNEYEYSVFGHSVELGLAAWIKNDEAVLLYDNYDIWMVDPSALKPPINITNGYGRVNNVKLRLVYERDDQNTFLVYSMSDTLLLTGFNAVTKYNGFFKKCLRDKGIPQLLTMGPFAYYHTGTQIPCADDYDDGMVPIKAKNTNVWIVKRQAVNDAPNYYYTNNLVDYIRLTDLQPQRKYNWLSTELISWSQPGKKPLTGVLYKPENFDPKKKYPIIFELYEEFSYMMFEYPLPGLAIARIDIPWYVGRGYLVFAPDIHYSIGSLSGEHAYSTVMSAVKYFSQKPWIDITKMGLNGHSFGGGETNYIIAHTSVFAAAAEASGRSDFLSAYLGLSDLKGTAGDVQSVIEVSHERLAATPWQRPDLYTNASSVLRADKISTPLLIMHNKADGAINWTQGMELYLALRRLEKKVWMLQYDDGGHILRPGGKEATDYTIRFNQFFDHYLKNASPPKWMTEGIPGKLKGIETGYDLDTSGKKP